MIKSLLLVSLGAAFGAPTRYLFYTITSPAPISTWLVNGLGSFLLGFITIYFHQKLNTDYSKSLILIFSVGFLGSFTTFSTFAGEIYGMLESNWLKAVSWAFFQMLSGVILFFIGIKSASFIFSP